MRIAVVGLGATGIVVLMRLVDCLVQAGREAGVEILLVERQEAPGLGVAYRTPHDCHLLNMRIDTMSLYDDRPGDFAVWVRQRYPEGVGTPYLPRRYFAEYLRTCFDSTLEQAADAGITVRYVTGEATDCRGGADRVTIVIDGVLYTVDYAVLCLGDLPSTNFLEHRASPHYRHSPWDLGADGGIDPDATVGVLGAGLTAVDVVLLLRARGHRGPIICFTRRSGLGKVQPLARDYRPHVPQVVTAATIRRLTRDHTRRLTLDQAWWMFATEIRDATGMPLDGTVLRDLPRRLNADRSAAALAHDIAETRAGRVSWYPVLVSTWRILPWLWRHLDERAKATFMARYYSYWGMYRHCIPLSNAVLLHEMVQRGQLTFWGGLSTITATAAGFTLGCTGSSRPERVDLLVNATGTGFDVRRTASVLLRTLLFRGEAVAHPLGGVDVDFDTLRLRDTAGSVVRRVHLVGPLTRGVHFYTNGVEASRMYAESLVDALLVDAGLVVAPAGG
jgi:uncharacterized NAD(P)/FAD-binding protein YdhS